MTSLITGLTLISAYIVFNKIFIDIKEQEAQDQVSRFKIIQSTRVKRDYY